MSSLWFGDYYILQASQHAIFFCARVPQIWKNFTVRCLFSVTPYYTKLNACSIFCSKLIFISRIMTSCMLLTTILLYPFSTVWKLSFMWRDVFDYKMVAGVMQNKSTGELSFLTCLMNFAGSLGKIEFWRHNIF